MSASNLRTQIKSILDQLVTDEVLASVHNRSFKHHPLADPEITRFPAAVIQPPSFESEVLDTASNQRTYTFDIVILMKGDDISSVDDVETLAETIANAFDDKFTLNGVAEGSVEPAVSPTEVQEYNSKQYVLFVVTIKPRTCYTITS